MPERGAQPAYGFIATVESVTPDSPGAWCVEYSVHSDLYSTTYGERVYGSQEYIDTVEISAAAATSEPEMKHWRIEDNDGRIVIVKAATVEDAVETYNLDYASDLMVDETDAQEFAEFQAAEQAGETWYS
jgi:hypothetical protein